MTHVTRPDGVRKVIKAPVQTTNANCKDTPHSYHRTGKSSHGGGLCIYFLQPGWAVFCDLRDTQRLQVLGRQMESKSYLIPLDCIYPIWIPQLSAIPSVGYSGVLTSYIGAIKFFFNAHEIIQEGYEKVSHRRFGTKLPS